MDPNPLSRSFHPTHGPSHFVDLIERAMGSDAANQVTEAIEKAKAGGIPWLKIIMALLPFILALLAGKPIDIQALIAAILALLGGG